MITAAGHGWGVDKEEEGSRVTALVRMVLVWRMMRTARVLRQHQVLQVLEAAQAATLLQRL